LKNAGQVEHLDGTSDKHDIDVASNARLKSNGSLSAEAEIALLESMYRSKNGAVGGRSPRPDLVFNIWFGDSGAGFQDPHGSDGTAKVLEGKQWQATLKEADRNRKEWRDSKGQLRRVPGGLELLLTQKQQKAVAPALFLDLMQDDVQEPGQKTGKKKKGQDEMSGKIVKIFARLPPWLALEAGKELDRKRVGEAVVEVAMALQQETGLRVLSASIHVETNYDIHVHFSCTRLVPSRETKKYAKDSAQKILRVHRLEVRARLAAEGIKKPKRVLIDERLAALYADKSNGFTDPRVASEKLVYRALTDKGVRKHLLSMGPAYCSKATLWETSGRDPKVAAVNELALAKSFSFGEFVIEKSKLNGNDPANRYLDFWLWGKWTDAITSKLSKKTREMLPELAKPFVDRYIRDGASLPNPLLDAARAKATGEVVGVLQAARDRLAGADKPPTSADTVPGLVDEIAVIIAEKERLATQARTALDEAATKEKAAARIKTRAERELLQASADKAAVDSEFAELAAAKQEIAVENHLLQCREEKIVELEQKAGLWDRVVPMIQGMVRMLPENLQNLVTTALANDPGDTVPDSKINSWIKVCARLARLAMTKPLKAKDIDKDGTP